MIVVMKAGCSQDEISHIATRIEDLGLKVHISQGVEHTVIGVLGKVFPELRDTLELLPGVDQVIPVSKPYKLASREFHPRDTIVQLTTFNHCSSGQSGRSHYTAWRRLQTAYLTLSISWTRRKRA